MEDSGESILFCEKNPHPEEKQLEEPNPSTLFFSLACIINKTSLRWYAPCGEHTAARENLQAEYKE